MDAAVERKTVRVTIYNQPYTLVASEEPGEVEALAHMVDELMTEIAPRAGNADSNRVAVLACLHLADRLQSSERELVRLRARVDGKAREFTVLLDEALK